MITTTITVGDLENLCFSYDTATSRSAIGCHLTKHEPFQITPIIAEQLIWFGYFNRDLSHGTKNVNFVVVWNHHQRHRIYTGVIDTFLLKNDERQNTMTFDFHTSSANLKPSDIDPHIMALQGTGILELNSVVNDLVQLKRTLMSSRRHDPATVHALIARINHKSNTALSSIGQSYHPPLLKLRNELRD